MKRVARTDRSLDYLRLLANYAETKRIGKYSNDAIARFGDEVVKALEASVSSPTRIRGVRAEALFRAVVAGIGDVRLLKEEDAGETFYRGDDIQVPDFRVILSDGKPLLIEAKSVELTEKKLDAPLKLPDAYVRRLNQYATLTETPLAIAIFWEGLGLWTLNELDAFEAGEANSKQWRLALPRAFATSQMRKLGDLMVATLAPLRFRVSFDPSRSDPMPPDGGPITATIERVQILSRDTVLTGEAAKLAWKLIWYGKWDEVDQEVVLDEGRLRSVDHIVAPPRELDLDDDGPQIVGALSELISRAYLAEAAETVHTSSVAPVVQPGYMQTFIPDNFRTLDLPIYLFHQQPNYDIDSPSAGA